MPSLYLINILFLILVCIVDGKILDGKLKLDKNNNFQVVDKFAFNIGKGNFIFSLTDRMKQLKDSQVSKTATLQLYMDEQWDDVLITRCEDRARLAKWESKPLNEMRVPIRHSLTQSIRPHVWYIVISDCQAKQHQEKTSGRYKLEWTQTDGSHFSYEEIAVSYYYPVMAALTMFALFPLKVMFDTQVKSIGYKHETLLQLMISVALFFASMVFETCHMWKFAKSGKGYVTMSLFAELTWWIGQVLVSSVLVGIAWGWTLDSSFGGRSRQEIPKILKNPTKIMIPSLILIHILFVILDRQYDDAHSKYHKSDSVWGSLMVLMRFLLGGVFGYGMFVLTSNEHSPLKRNFLYKLAIVGTIYFISIPIIVFIASFVASYLRHQVVTIGGILIQTGALIGLSILFLTRNEFVRMSTLSASSLPMKRV